MLLDIFGINPILNCMSNPSHIPLEQRVAIAPQRDPIARQPKPSPVIAPLVQDVLPAGA